MKLKCKLKTCQIELELLKDCKDNSVLHSMNNDNIGVLICPCCEQKTLEQS